MCIFPFPHKPPCLREYDFAKYDFLQFSNVISKKRTDLRVGSFYIRFDLFGGIVVEIALNVNDGRALVARACGKVAKRADKVGKASWRRALRCHLSNEVSVLFNDSFLDCRLKSLALKPRKIVIRKILELKLVVTSKTVLLR